MDYTFSRLTAFMHKTPETSAINPQSQFRFSAFSCSAARRTVAAAAPNSTRCAYGTLVRTVDVIAVLSNLVRILLRSLPLLRGTRLRASLPIFCPPSRIASEIFSVDFVSYAFKRRRASSVPRLQQTCACFCS